MIDDLKILKMMVEKKLDLTIKNKKGQTPIEIASTKGIINTLAQYLGKGSAVSDKGKKAMKENEKIYIKENNREDLIKIPKDKSKHRSSQDANIERTEKPDTTSEEGKCLVISETLSSGVI